MLFTQILEGFVRILLAYHLTKTTHLYLTVPVISSFFCGILCCYFPFFSKFTSQTFHKDQVVADFNHMLSSSYRPGAQKRFTKSRSGSRSWRTIIGLCGESPKRSRSHLAPLTQMMWTFDLAHYIQCTFSDSELLWRPAGRGTLKCSSKFEKEPTRFNCCY